MSTSRNSQVDTQQGPDRTLGLWNLHENLARLADELAKVARVLDSDPDNDNSGAEVAMPRPRDYFQSLLHLRRTRDQYFGSAPFGEPAWDIMLELMLARIDGKELRVSELAASSAFASPVVHEHLDALAEVKLIDVFDNTENQHDHFIALSSEAARRMAELYRARMRG